MCSHTHTHTHTHSLLYGSLILKKQTDIYTHTHAYITYTYYIHTFIVYLIYIKSIFYRFFDIKMNIIKSVLKM